MKRNLLEISAQKKNYLLGVASKRFGDPEKIGAVQDYSNLRYIFNNYASQYPNDIDNKLPHAPRMLRLIRNRRKGISRAVMGLAKESVEPLDERKQFLDFLPGQKRRRVERAALQHRQNYKKSFDDRISGRNRGRVDAAEYARDVQYARPTVWGALGLALVPPIAAGHLIAKALIKKTSYKENVRNPIKHAAKTYMRGRRA